MNLTKKFFSGWKDYMWIIVGSFISAIAINIFLVPYKIAPGGITGVATVMYYLSGGKFPVGITTLVLNIPLFVMGIKIKGGKFTVLTLFSTALQSVIIDVTEPLTRNFLSQFLTKYGNSSTPDLLLYAIFGGFIMGVGLGLVFRSGATTGGTDLAASIVNHYIPHITIGQILLVMDTAIVIFASIVFNSFILALYAIITMYVSTKVIDAILEGVNFAKAVYIISDKSDEIAERVMSELERGVTLLKGTGMYTGNDKNVLYCVLHRNQLPVLKSIVKNIDVDAFVILTDVREVLGEGFNSHN